MTVSGEFDTELTVCRRRRRRNRVVSTEMKDPRLSSVDPNMAVTNEVILSSQFSSDEDPFAEYMWMENEEEFNRQVEEELWEEEFIERCIQELLEEEEQWEWFIPSRDLPSQTVNQLQDQISLLVLDSDVHADVDIDVVVNSSLNPNAKEFIPGIQKHVM
ncbi:polyadenylate-binding protein-interacting protein 2-like [Chelmon rostratus]|uniref:polyadenylate-binding protein-interacting protein 2-like n=1 Tax=Chelmon rostratus TaxID=109905 RepID=UPI001BE60126|nr:polyadenylate-binding protein-interacting protein 2-like [Chelmon rostratus]